MQQGKLIRIDIIVFCCEIFHWVWTQFHKLNRKLLICAFIVLEICKQLDNWVKKVKFQFWIINKQIKPYGRWLLSDWNLAAKNNYKMYE